MKTAIINSKVIAFGEELRARVARPKTDGLEEGLFPALGGLGQARHHVRAYVEMLHQGKRPGEPLDVWENEGGTLRLLAGLIG
jgi:hypothetical protein